VRRERWLRAFAAVAIGVVACVLGGAFRADNFPLDDTYIHLAYGIDFTPGSLFSFQAFRRDTGTSSWLWTAICIAVVRLRLPVYPALTGLSVAIFCAILHRTMALVASALPRGVPLRGLWPYAAALLVAASGNVLWLSITGMETGLSVLLLLLTVPRVLSGRGMTPAAGLLALALVWTRIEGLVWLVSAAALVPFTGPRGARRAWRGWLLPLAGVALYVAYNLAVGGHLLPTSALSKRATFVPGGHSWKDEWSFLASLTRHYVVPQLPGWLVEAVAAAVSAVALLLLAVTGRGRAGLLRRPRIEPAVAAVAALLGGACAHVALNVVEFRSAYHHLRYFAPILYVVPALSLPVALGALHALGGRASRSLGSPAAFVAARWACVGLAAPLFVWAFARDLRAAQAWAARYLRNAAQLGAVHLDVGRFLRASAPPGTRRVASFDIGALRWASHLEVVDLAGTSDARTLGYQVARRQADLIRDTHAEYYVSIENGFDYVAPTQPAYELELVRTWQYPEYFDPFPPHSKRMVLYRVNHCGAPRLHRQPVGVALRFDFDPGDAAARVATGVAQGDAFARWPVTARELGRPVALARGRFLSSDAHPLRDKAVGRFETVPMKIEGDWLSFRMAGGHDPRRLRVELRSEGRALASWTGFDADSFLEIVHPVDELRGRVVTLTLVDEARGGWGHLMLDEVQQFVWSEAPPRACPRR
jgi:hypothetical protein